LNRQISNRMAAFYDRNILPIYTGKRIVIDTNVIAICSTDSDFLRDFKHIFSDFPLLLDPIVKLEFLRGSQTEKLFNGKKEFLEINGFYEMPDHQEIYKRVYKNSIDVARIYSSHNKPDLKLGDLFIISRLILYPDYLFLTKDISDFTTMLFNRIGIFSIEHKTIKNPSESLIVEHLCLLQFNFEKYQSCLKRLQLI